MIIQTIRKSQVIKTLVDFREAKEAQSYMLDQLRKYPPAQYDTALSAIPKTTKDGFFYTVLCARAASPL